jgi:hypothetical protein
MAHAIYIGPPPADGLCWWCGEQLPHGTKYFCNRNEADLFRDKYSLSPTKILQTRKDPLITVAMVQQAEREERLRELKAMGFTPSRPVSRAPAGAPVCRERMCNRRLSFPIELEKNKCLTHIQRDMHRSRDERVFLTTDKSRLTQTPHNKRRRKQNEKQNTAFTSQSDR